MEGAEDKQVFCTGRTLFGPEEDWEDLELWDPREATEARGTMAEEAEEQESTWAQPRERAAWEESVRFKTANQEGRLLSMVSEGLEDQVGAICCLQREISHSMDPWELVGRAEVLQEASVVAMDSVQEDPLQEDMHAAAEVGTQRAQDPKEHREAMEL